MRRRLRQLFVETGGANERSRNCLDGSRDPLAILAGIPSCSHLRAHLAFSDSKGLFDQRTRNGDSRSNAGLDRNRSVTNWPCRCLINVGRCTRRRWRRCSEWFPCLCHVPVSAVLAPGSETSGLFRSVLDGTPPRACPNSQNGPLAARPGRTHSSPSPARGAESPPGRHRGARYAPRWASASLLTVVSVDPRTLP